MRFARWPLMIINDNLSDSVIDEGLYKVTNLQQCVWWLTLTSTVFILWLAGVRGSSRWRGRISFHHSSPGSQEGADFDRRKQELAKCHLRITFREYFHNPMKYEGESDWTMCTMQTQIRDLRYLSDSKKKQQNFENARSVLLCNSTHTSKSQCLKLHHGIDN